MTRWPRRARPDPGDLPAPLAEFCEADWSEWLLDGPDPGTEGYVDAERFYAGLADRPAVAACWRRLDAHKRWSAARRAWLEAHGHPQLAFDGWIDDIAYEHRVLRAEIRAATDRVT
jgi:hypothetical protein